ncbi:hypothetical protein B8W66_15810 [Mycobacterium decipiens]|uniref:Uncharacterized protein n=1 Tax=Mycobacterium decipiens TaxID=1430326 RepID=A0A1X2LSV4_9MYCO|nr:hypothetical protein B8W66_15810 [Mycobacterium decipiens]
MVDLAIPDQHRCPGVYRHSSNLARRRCGPWNGPRRSCAIGPSAATMRAVERPEEELRNWA